MRHRILPTCLLTCAVVGATGGAYASLESRGPRMGPTTTVKPPAFHGYYDARDVGQA
jgi:hypothetical protein